MILEKRERTSRLNSDESARSTNQSGSPLNQVGVTYGSTADIQTLWRGVTWGTKYELLSKTSRMLAINTFNYLEVTETRWNWISMTKC